MILILSISKHNKGTWLLYKKEKVTKQNFDLVPGIDRSLFFLDKFLKKEKIKLKNIKGIVFLAKEASLTQVKIFTTTLNSIAWHLGVPIKAKFYFKEDFEIIMNKILKDFPQKSEFKAIKAEYSRAAVITLSKKKAKYKISH